MPLQKIPSAPRLNGRARSLADRTAVIRLFDAYAGLLTARQQRLVRMYYHEDLSLGEIGGRLRVSRQAVFDSLRRSVDEVRHLEDRLRVLADAGRNGRERRDRAAARLFAVERAAARLTAAGAATGPLLRALRALREVM
ncbi:MAG TPA: sigma factor-like helix-turn-helix DNA-binding protein [bacterium]|nr:sigma factor-like helix-turn-helix DNA-binding protein [bacterium]